MVEVMKITATSFKSPLHTVLHSVPLTLQQATVNSHLCQRLLDTHGHIWVSLLWGHCSFLLGSGTYKILFVPSKGLFPQSCIKFCNQIPLLHSICQQIWKTQQWPRDWKNSVLIPIPKKGNAKECSNYCTMALISHATQCSKFSKPGFSNT